MGQRGFAAVRGVLVSLIACLPRQPLTRFVQTAQ